MKKQAIKPAVAPPASYTAPSLPTLAAFGLFTAVALTTGCKDEPRLGGSIVEASELSAEESMSIRGGIREPRYPERETEFYRTAGIFMSPTVRTNTPPPKPERETTFYVTAGIPALTSPKVIMPKPTEPEAENQ